ncbi:MAG: hypothetical protein CVV18_01370 [Gammaproteobacteria bacterium HGW-Gammaproteobacteria-8]|nr:MAG: hypothetical protein CVV18_01370 [Gammaproteobacteria bacterium HGW-Gammaproteobacteria-8]
MELGLAHFKGRLALKFLQANLGCSAIAELRAINRTVNCLQDESSPAGLLQATPPFGPHAKELSRS